MADRFTFAKFRGVIRGRAKLALCLALCTPAFGLSQGVHSATIIIIDAPGAGTGGNQGQGTWGLSINPAGAITGYFIDAQRVYHGFLRAADGTITSFDAPGAGERRGQAQGTYPLSINRAGATTGFLIGAGNGTHGFLRAPDGTFTTFDVLGALPFSGGTQPQSINPAGAITGIYFGTGGTHSFLRAPDGTITTFDAPDATSVTQAQSINPAGAIAGFFFDPEYVSHGFLRAPDGTFTTIDVPGACKDNGGTRAHSINPAGAITGQYGICSGNWGGHAFVRAPNGTITTFHGPAPSGTIIQPQSINPAGWITGYILKFSVHGFLQGPHGAMTMFDAPGAGAGFEQGTIPQSINLARQITGVFFDAQNVAHGFLRIP